MVKVAVIGAGVIGLSTAYYLKITNPAIDVKIIAKTTAPNTCSDVAAGLWEPFVMSETPMELQRKWSKITWDHIENLKERRDASELSILTMPAYGLENKEMEELPLWKDIVPDMRFLTKKELLQFPAKYKSGYIFTTYIIETTKYLKWLMKQFADLQGSIEIKTVNSISELADSYDIVVNCTGIGARELCGDTTVEPVRGQVMRVKAPWINRVILAEAGDKVGYIIPNSDTVVLGGTIQKGNYSKEINAADKEHIIRETMLLEPSLKNNAFIHVKDVVDLRPSRPAVRLEKEDIDVSHSSLKKTTLKVVHNYGHGGAGVTVHWGCAADATKLVLDCIAELNMARTIHQAKL